ncbi:MAG: hypothetical protein ABF296_10155, partial [Oceanococcaceae bacterium]
KCTAPLAQHRGDPVVFDGPLLDTAQALPDLAPKERDRLAGIKREAKTAKQTQADDARREYVEDRAAELAAEAVGIDASAEDFEAAVEQARGTIRRALDRRALDGSWPLIFADGSTATVGEALDEPARYHGKLTLDPIEPDYDGRRPVGKLYLFSGRPTLYSFAHGGRSFRLLRQPARVQLVGGHMREAVDDTLRVLRDAPDVFDLGDQIATVHGGAARALDADGLAYYLGGAVRFYSLRQAQGDLYERDEDPPPKLCKMLLTMGMQARGLKPLDAIVTAPVIPPHGRVLSQPGHHADARLLVAMDDAPPPVPEHPSDDDLRNAYGELLRPFELFPFASDLDRSVLLTGLLSAVERPVLPTCPAFGFDAPVQGSGKTLLAQCLGALGTGEEPAIWPHTAGKDGDEETRKRLLTALRDGDRAVVWDNILGIFDSASLAAALTSPVYRDRVLGYSTTATVPNRALFLLTGNNLCLSGDMPRRVLVCRIDPQSERPFARRFDMNPLTYVLTHRQRLVRAALTIIRGWLSTRERGEPQADGEMASFEAWDRLVRQPVAWLARRFPDLSLVDPMQAIDQAQSADPTLDALGIVLRVLRERFDSRAFTAKDVHGLAVASFPAFDNDDELREALTELNNGNPIRSSRTVGMLLKYRKGRICAGLRLAELPRDRAQNVPRYAVQTVAGAAIAGTTGTTGTVSPQKKMARPVPWTEEDAA